MKKLLINVFDTDLQWLGTIEDIETLTLRTSWHEIVNSEMKVSKKAQGVEHLQAGRILVVNNQREKALIIEDKTTSLNDNYWNFNLIPLKALLNYRICHPQDGGTMTAKKQSEVMMLIAQNNLVTQTRDVDRRFWDSAHSRNMFEVMPLKAYGETIDFTVDWKTGYLGDAIVTISKMHHPSNYPIGWNVYISNAWNAYQMDTYQLTDRSIAQSERNPVVFSEEFGNIRNATYTYSIKDFRNIGYVVWNETNNTLVGNWSYGPTLSFNRKEILLSSSKKTANEVSSEGRSEINKRPIVETFTAEIINNENTMSTYGVDWFLGDIVTIQSKSIKKDQALSINVQITEIEEIYDNGEYSVNATFGEGKLTFIQLLKSAINQK